MKFIFRYISLQLVWKHNIIYHFYSIDFLVNLSREIIIKSNGVGSFFDYSLVIVLGIDTLI
jgi:hypothetical protein